MENIKNKSIIPLDILSAEFAKYIVSTFPFIKNPIYSSEEEHRLVYLTDKNPPEEELYKKEGEPLEAGNPTFLSATKGIDKVFYKLQLKKEKINIKQIYIGPRNDFNKVKADLEQKLKDFGYENVEIIKSQLEYRV